MTWKQICALGLQLPEVSEGQWFGTPALLVCGKSFVRLKEDGKTVVFLTESIDEQEFLVASRPRIYHVTDHYRGYPAVLARLSALNANECRVRLEVAWRKRAPKKLARQLDSQRSRLGVSPRADRRHTVS